MKIKDYADARTIQELESEAKCLDFELFTNLLHDGGIPQEYTMQDAESDKETCELDTMSAQELYHGIITVASLQYKYAEIDN